MRIRVPKLKEKPKERKYPPVNKLRACIFDRKFVSKMTWQEITAEAHIDYDYFRKLMSNKDPWEWPDFVREGICGVLEISVKKVVSDGWDD